MLPTPEGLTEDRVRKIMEIVAMKVGIGAELYVPKRQAEKKPQHPKSDTGIVVVKPGANKSYADLLKEVKREVSNSTFPLQEPEARIGGSAKILNINGIDAVTEKEEVVIKDQIGELNAIDDSIMVKSLRSTMRGNQIVDADEELAEKLLSEGRLRLGWLNCPIRDRVEIPRCYKYQQFGHLREECKGEDREGDCLRCGQK
ncbi:unnamed protein product [Psylliodes chrysocephalus]|uniref:CCHC-type domain-containing protein n=1 Tax=Psylliodes chrysocephalus TaxID=3402493 RepID=A0A9P0GF60_9CUCU|nr:unnamed protein product [Psylliodes chrysocephala]